jgi:hypothetical protein
LTLHGQQQFWLTYWMMFDASGHNPPAEITQRQNPPAEIIQRQSPLDEIPLLHYISTSGGN